MKVRPLWFTRVVRHRVGGAPQGSMLGFLGPKVAPKIMFWCFEQRFGCQSCFPNEEENERKQ